jgi:mono/diheme cytochrome c family protein
MRHMMFAMILAAGCAADPTTGGGGPSVFPNEQIYAGVYEGGGATGKVTIAAMDATGMSWSSGDTSVATVSGNDTLGTVTAVKAGSTTITAKAGGVSMPVPVMVISYTAAQLSAGSAAFQAQACGSCHNASGPDISPSGIGKHTDQQIIDATVSGKNPEGGEVSIGAAMHSFALTGDAKIGIAAYVRSLTPGTPVADN